MKSSIYDYLLPYEGKTIKIRYNHTCISIDIGFNYVGSTAVIIEKVLSDAIVIKKQTENGFFGTTPAHTQIIPFGIMHISIEDEKTAS